MPVTQELLHEQPQAKPRVRLLKSLTKQQQQQQQQQQSQPTHQDTQSVDEEYTTADRRNLPSGQARSRGPRYGRGAYRGRGNDRGGFGQQRGDSSAGPSQKSRTTKAQLDEELSAMAEAWQAMLEENINCDDDSEMDYGE